jgi:hypothetical protein
MFLRIYRYVRDTTCLLLALKKVDCLENGVPDATRTHDLRLRRPTLYPTELQAHTYI